MRRNVAFLTILLVLLVCGGTSYALDGWGDPAGGWDLLVEFDDLLGVALATDDAAALDGTWNHDNGSDAWDGSVPGEADKAPGGVMVEEAEGVVVLSIEDAGDPRDAGFSDPSNRKLYFTKEIAYDGDILADGVTLVARMRINPNPVDAPADGYDLHDGAKGQVGIGSLAVPKLFSLALDTGALRFGAEDQEPVAIANELEFQSIWATVMGDGDMHNVNVYLNGSTDPVFSGPIALGDGSDSDFANYLAVGMGSTGRDGAVQIDYVGYKAGLFAPGAATAIDPSAKLSTRWAEIKE
jgi:hypothetical protein